VESERERTTSPSIGNSLCRALWTLRKTGHMMNEWKIYDHLNPYV